MTTTNPTTTRYLVQQYYPRGGWVTEEECLTIEDARHEVRRYRQVNEGRTRLRIKRAGVAS